MASIAASAAVRSKPRQGADAVLRLARSSSPRPRSPPRSPRGRCRSGCGWCGPACPCGFSTSAALPVKVAVTTPGTQSRRHGRRGAAPGRARRGRTQHRALAGSGIPEQPEHLLLMRPVLEPVLDRRRWPAPGCREGVMSVMAPSSSSDPARHRPDAIAAALPPRQRRKSAPPPMRGSSSPASLARTTSTARSLMRLRERRVERDELVIERLVSLLSAVNSAGFGSSI